MQRQDQYIRKIEYILEMISLFKTPTNRDQRDALFYRIETAVEASMDIIAMLVKDHGKTVKDDYHNIDTLEEEAVFPAEFTQDLRQINGLRNALAHRYNKFEEKTVTENIDKIKTILQQVIEIGKNETKN